MEGKAAVRFNVILLGDSGTGKTAFLRSFQEAFCVQTAERGRKQEGLIPSTQSIDATRFSVELSAHTLTLSLIDTPGYGQFSSLFTWQAMVESFISDQAVSYYENAQKLPEDDPRVHLCLYFLAGPRVRESDLRVMLSLQDTVLLVPVMAKCEAMTAGEALEVKVRTVEQCEFAGIRLLDVTQLAGDVVRRLNESPLGPCPPFALFSHCQMTRRSDGRSVLGRKYRWGVLEAGNPAHSDFSLLCDMLLHTFPAVCVSHSEEIGRSLARKHEERVGEMQRKSQEVARGDRFSWARTAAEVVLRLLR